MESVLIAFGGNVISRTEERGEIAEQFAHSAEALSVIVDYLRKRDYTKLLLTHGNGPQIGRILLRSELTYPEIPLLPLATCVSDSQGGMGYMLQQIFQNLLRKANIDRDVVTLLTQVEVDASDPAFQKPTKPIGKFHTKEESELLEKSGWNMMFDSGRGYRRVVASPPPIKVIETQPIKTLLNSGSIVIAGGGGGIPVIKDEDGNFHGADAVIDKDLTSSMMATDLEISNLIIVTGVDQVYINFGKENQEALPQMTLARAKELLSEGQFGVGSMAPKIKALISFIENGGKKAAVCSPFNLKETLEEKSGTYIIP